MQSMIAHIHQALQAYDSIDLDALNQISLLNRVDTKYLLQIDKIPQILAALQEDYFVLDIEDQLIFTYENKYFDTADFLFFQMHHRGVLNRFKVRIRRYIESDLRYLEIKEKTNKKRTHKTRIKLDQNIGHLDTRESRNFIEGITDVKAIDLSQHASIKFNRIALVHKTFKERCTLDFNLNARWGNLEKDFGKLAIAELKQSRFDRLSKFHQVLKSNKIYPQRFSKYCMSLTYLNESLKSNRFKTIKHKLNKLIA